MEFCQLDKIYHLLKDNKTEIVNTKYDKAAIDCVKRLRFRDTKQNNNNLEEREKKYELKEKRTSQKKFADRVKNRYLGKCPISGHINFFQACHILPYCDCSNEEEACSEYNGILLSNTLHDAFDKNYFTFDENKCCVKILNSKHGLENMGLKDSVYIHQLDNIQSKKYLKLRNLKIEKA